jgi:metal-dependent amidase/aminoacylase/carboxypeptidase family protein
VVRIAENIARAHGAEAATVITRGFPVTVCDPRAVLLAERAITNLFGATSWQTMQKPIMGAEDFSYVLQRVPGAMMMLGVCPDGQDWHTACPCHSNKMMLNESVLARGVAAHCAVAEHFLAEGLPTG